MKSPPWLLAAPGTLEAGRIFSLEPEEGRHAAGSLRLRAGDAVVLADGRGTTAPSVVRSVVRGRVEVEVEDVRCDPQPSRDVQLALAVIEPRAMDWAVQKAVEVGVGRLTPVRFERSQARRGDGRRRLEHWRRIARQAIKQCRRSWFMEVEDTLDLSELLSRTPPGRGIVADPLGAPLDELPTTVGWVLAVGPEGGFSEDESRLLANAGWRSLCLGRHILRTETAGIVGAALLMTRVEHDG